MYFSSSGLLALIGGLDSFFAADPPRVDTVTAPASELRTAIAS